MTPTLRALFLSDTHLGFDMPVRPRVERRRRGPDFYRMFALAMEAAVRERVDLVVHGGDVFHRSRVRAGFVLNALDLVRPVTEAGIPVVIVPGNHERSVLPLRMLWTMPNLHVFDAADTITLTIRGLRVGLAGFPFHRRDIRGRFPELVTRTASARHEADIRLLCLHHAVEGAQVGPSDYTFRSGRDVVAGRLIPAGFAAVLSGHIHRAQILRADLAGRPLASPVFYPGSTERTAFAESKEAKGYWILELASGPPGGRVAAREFRELPARPMATVNIPARPFTGPELHRWLHRALSRLHPESVVRVRSSAGPEHDLQDRLGVASLRALAPPTQSVEWHGTGRGGENQERSRRVLGKPWTQSRSNPDVQGESEW